MNQPTTPNTVEDFLPLPASQAYVKVWNATEAEGESLQSANAPYFTADQVRAAILADRAQRPTVSGSVDTPEVDTAMRVVMRDDFLGWTAREKECFRIGYSRARLAPAAPSGEPKAWLVLDATDVEPLCTVYRKEATKHYAALGHKVIELFDHPAPSSPTAQGLPAQAVPEGWREALLEMQHKLNSARIWGGMGWKYNPLHYLHYKPVLDKINLLLAHQDTAQVAANKQEGK